MDDNKAQQWQEIAERLAKTTDRLGLGIDKGIMETVIVFNLLGFHTRQSCEGHLERGTGAPWVTFEQPGLEEEEERAYQMMDDARKLQEQGMLPKQEIRQRYDEAHRQRELVKAKHMPLRYRMMAYLEQFYTSRYVPYDRRLIIHGFWSGTSRLQSQGADCQDVAPPEVRDQKLQEYQEEMAAFTAFLKEIWLQDKAESSS